MLGTMHGTAVRGLAIAIGAIVGLAMGCQRPARGADSAMNATSASTQGQLIGPTWSLVELSGQPAPLGAGDRPATLIIQDGGEPRASGFAGCNRWFSAYTLTAPDRIHFTAPGSTKMACASGMDLEQRFLAIIAATRGYTLSDSTLVLLDQSGASHARLVAR